MKRYLNEDALKDLIWGATLFGGGGGGSLQSGLDMLESYKAAHPGVAPKLELITYDEMDGLAAVTAGMGSPQAIVGQDFSQYAINAFELLQVMAKREDKALKYCIPVELGGFNTFVPMLISLVKGIPFVDADGAGRAVPALDTLLLHVNGCATSPLAMANDKNDKVTIELSDPHNARLAELLGRDVCVEFGMKSGLSGWMVTADEIRDRIVDGSITIAEKVGHIFRTAADKTDLFAKVKADGCADVKGICTGKVTKIFTDTAGGFDVGYVMVEGDTGTYKISFQNENLLLSKQDGDKFVPLMTVPDITCMYCIKPTPGSVVLPGMPMSNADVKEGMEVGLGVMKVNHKWFITDGTWWNVWADYLAHVDYTGKNIPFESVK
ncbi:MAG: DUF917 domain-containing protein [Oscillospiraceae bacterium]